MNTNNYQYESAQTGNGAKHIVTGILVGGIIGATAMLFLAPRSGEEMRADVVDKAMELKDRTAETVKDTMSQVKSKTGSLKGDVTGKAQDLKSRGQDLLVEQLDRASEAVAAAKKAIEHM